MVYLIGFFVSERRNFHVLDAHRRLAPDRPDDSRHLHRLAAAIEGGAGIHAVDTLERVREEVGVALSLDLTVRDDVDAGVDLVLHHQARGIGLRLRQVRFRQAPQLRRTRARWEAAFQHFLVDQPIRLGITAYQRARKQRLAHDGPHS